MRWAVDEMGRNSVIPSTAPSTMDCAIVMYVQYNIRAGETTMVTPIDYLMTITELHETLEFLEKTDMVMNVSNPLSVLRVQVGSPYVKMLEYSKLLAEKTEDLVFYNAHFKDPKVEFIARLAQDWLEEQYQFMFALKGEVAVLTLNRERDERKRLLFIFKNNLLSGRYPVTLTSRLLSYLISRCAETRALDSFCSLFPIGTLYIHPWLCRNSLISIIEPL